MLRFKGFADGEERLFNGLGIVFGWASEGPAFKNLDRIGAGLNLAGEIKDTCLSENGEELGEGLGIGLEPLESVGDALAGFSVAHIAR